MNATQIVLKRLFEAFGQPLELTKFGERLKIQKRIYLFQLCGVDLGYRFAWYIYGPYCRELTRDVFRLLECVDDGETVDESTQLAPFACSAVNQAKKVWQNRPIGVIEEDWLELLASLHYLKHIAYFANGSRRDFNTIFDALVHTKHKYHDKRPIAEQAWNQLEGVGLLQHKVLSRTR